MANTALHSIAKITFFKTILALVLCTLSIDSVCAQDRVLRKNYLTDIPFSDYLPYSRPAVISTSQGQNPGCFVRNDIYQVRVYFDFSLHSFCAKDDAMDQILYLKMHIPGSDMELHAIEAHIPEHDSDELIIINTENIISDRLRAVHLSATPWTLARDYEITEKWEIFIYSIIPDSDSPVDLLEFGLDPSNSINARLRTEVYEIRNDKFVLKDSAMSEAKIVRAGDFSRDTKLKEMFGAYDNYLKSCR